VESGSGDGSALDDVAVTADREAASWLFAIGKEAVETNADESTGSTCNKEAPQELVRRERHQVFLVAWA